MKRVLIIVLAIVALLGLPACGGSGGGGGVVDNIIDNNASGYLGGTWSGTLTSKLLYGAMTFHMTITQRANGDLAGTASISGKFSDNKGVLVGTVSNPSGKGDIAFTVSWGSGDTMTFAGTYNANTMSGGYTSLTLNDAGTFKLNK